MLRAHEVGIDTIDQLRAASDEFLLSSLAGLEKGDLAKLRGAVPEAEKKPVHTTITVRHIHKSLHDE